MPIVLASMIVGAVVMGYLFYEMKNYDPSVFAYSKQQAQSMLVDARTTLPRRDGDGQIQIWSVGPSARGVALKMQYASGAPVLTCEAVVTAIAPDKTRVVPACSSGSASDAISRTQEDLQTPMFEEHILATLNKRPFDRSRADRKEVGVVFKNLGAMQNEALQRAQDVRRMEAEFRR
jgi:hypothetical protein